MEIPITWLVVTLAGLIVSARTTVHLPVLGPTPVLAILALTVALAMALGVLTVARVLIRDGLRLRPVAS